MHVVVTGGAGFIGSHLVDALIERGHAVTVLDNFSNGSMNNVKPHMKNRDFKLVKGDIRDKAALKRALHGADAVVHLAAMISVPLSVKNPKLAQEVNVEGTLSILTASREAEVKRFVYASTCAVYGEAKKLPITEDTPPNPLSPYARSKLDAEESCHAFYGMDGFPAISLRYFNVYGPRQSGGEYAGVMLKFFERLKNNQPPIIYGDGTQTRDFIYVGDAVEATLLALEKGGIEGEVINVGTMKRTNINELCRMFIRLSGKDLNPIYEAARPGDIKHSQADISKAQKLLGFEPKVPIERGVEILWKYLEAGQL